MQITQSLYFEEFEVGQKFRSPGRTVTETDIVNFIALANMYEPLFANLEYIRNESTFKRRVAPGALTYALAEGLMIVVGTFNGTGLAFLQAEFTLPRPVYVDDTLFLEEEVIDKHETSKPERGIITTKETVCNQRGEEVLIRTVKRMVLRQPPQET